MLETRHQKRGPALVRQLKMHKKNFDITNKQQRSGHCLYFSTMGKRATLPKGV